MTYLNRVATSRVKVLFRKVWQNKKTSIEAVTVHDVTEMDCIWAVVTTARIQLKADEQYFKTAPVITN